MDEAISQQAVVLLATTDRWRPEDEIADQLFILEGEMKRSVMAMMRNVAYWVSVGLDVRRAAGADDHAWLLHYRIDRAQSKHASIPR